MSSGRRPPRAGRWVYRTPIRSTRCRWRCFETASPISVRSRTHRYSTRKARFKQLVNKGAKFQYTAFQPLGTGTEVLAQAWNGDVILIPDYLPKGKSVDTIGFYFPPDGKAAVNNDFWSIPKTSKNPVLAHLWMDHFLQAENAIDNYRSVGYQQPLNTLSFTR